VIDGGGAGYCSISFSVPGVWASEVTVSLNLVFNERAQVGIELDTKITWSSTDRDLASATVAVAQYQKAIEFIALAEAIFNR